MISIEGKNFKQFRDTKYYCSEDGEVYSDFSHKILKPLLRGRGNKQYHHIDINFGEGQKHYPIHKLVYETWIGEIPEGMLVLHKDDNQFNNKVENLYLGDQKQNIKDCTNNKHRDGNTWILTVYDKDKNKTLAFCPAIKFMNYCGHTCANGSLKRIFTRNWFKERYEVIDYSRCENLKMLQEGVTTMGDECNPVE